jgi:hypothetical protein
LSVNYAACNLDCFFYGELWCWLGFVGADDFTFWLERSALVRAAATHGRCLRHRVGGGRVVCIDLAFGEPASRLASVYPGANVVAIA